MAIYHMLCLMLHYIICFMLYYDRAEDAIDKLLETNTSLVSSRPTHRNSQTLHLPLIGQHGMY